MEMPLRFLSLDLYQENQYFILNRDMKVPVGLGIAFPSAQGDMFADVDNQPDVGRRIVNQGAAGDIDQNCVLLYRREETRIGEPPRFVGERTSQDNDIGLG